MSAIFESHLQWGRDSRLNSPGPVRNEHSASDHDVLRRLYAKMLTCRMARESAHALVRNGRIACSGVSFIAAEAAEVGATYDLQPSDSLTTWQHDVFTNLLKGASLGQVFAQLLGQTAGSNVRDNLASWNIIPPASTLAGQLSLATGVALAYKHQGQRNVVLALCGQGFAALGMWHDAARLAAEQRLPLIFVIDSGRMRDQDSNHWFGPAEDLSHRAHAYGFPGITVDGNDAVAVFRVTQESIHRARSGAGPTLVECKSLHPFRETTAERPGSGRRRRRIPVFPSDPLAHMEHYLSHRGAWRSSWKRQLVEQIAGEIDKAITLAENER